MLVKDLIKQLEDIPEHYIVGFVDENGKVTDPTGKIDKLNALEILLLH